MPASKPATTSNEDVRDTPRNSAASDPDAGDGLDKVELSDLESTPPPLPIESDLMQLARLGELRAIQKLFDSGRYNAKSTDEQGITALHVCTAHRENRADKVKGWNCVG
jgi:protein AFG1